MSGRRRRLLGFDARLDEEDNRRCTFPVEAREVLLLRPEIECPLAVDTHIWPSHFLYRPELRGFADPQEGALIEVECAEQAPHLYVWLSLARMRLRLSQCGVRAEVIAVELLGTKDTAPEDFEPEMARFRPEPEGVPEGSTFLGYDVADEGFFSGLSNCGYSPAEREVLRMEWAGRINQFGLLTDEDEALLFSDMTDRRVPEHAPFWVFGLYRVPL